MFSNPTSISKDFDEGDVTEVDVLRQICKIKTVFGKNIQCVKWMSPYGGSSRSGDRGTPISGDRVYIFHGYGYPLIIGYAPKPQVYDESTVVSIAGTPVIDTGNFSSSVTANSGVDLNKPNDMHVGDRILATIGGALIALLRGGSILIRSNYASEIFLSKYVNLVRIVSGNWEHFTDVCSDTIKNWRGRVFRYTGSTNTYAKSKTESYDYHEYVGDVALAEALKTNYNQDVIPPLVGTVIKKEQVWPSTSTTELMCRTISLDGTDEVVVSGTDGGNNPIFTRIKQQNGMIYASFNDTSFVQLNATSITLSKDVHTSTTYDTNGIHSIEAGGSSVNMNAGVITLTDAHNAVALLSGGNITLTDSAGGIIKTNGGDITLHDSGGGSTVLSSGNITLTGSAGASVLINAAGITLNPGAGVVTMP